MMNVTPVFSAGQYSARPLAPSDFPALQNLLEACDDYYQSIYGHPARANEVEQMLAERPAGLSEGQAHLWGVVTETTGVLVGVLEFLSDYPARGDWYIGLLLLLPSVRNQGLGAALADGLATWAAAQGATTLYALVAEHSASSQQFWARRGFAVERRLGPLRYGARDSLFLRMRRVLPSPST